MVTIDELRPRYAIEDWYLHFSHAVVTNKLHSMLSHQPVTQLIRTCSSAICDNLERLQQTDTGFGFSQQLQNVRDNVEALGMICVLECRCDVCGCEREFGREEREKLAAMDGSVEARVCNGTKT